MRAVSDALSVVGSESGSELDTTVTGASCPASRKRVVGQKNELSND